MHACGANAVTSSLLLLCTQTAHFCISCPSTDSRKYESPSTLLIRRILVSLSAAGCKRSDCSKAYYLDGETPTNSPKTSETLLYLNAVSPSSCRPWSLLSKTSGGAKLLLASSGATVYHVAHNFRPLWHRWSLVMDAAMSARTLGTFSTCSGECVPLIP